MNVAMSWVECPIVYTVFCAGGSITKTTALRIQKFGIREEAGADAEAGGYSELEMNGK
jgi:hypothetical protein